MDLLSQLAENVVRQIDADSRNRFQTALNELTDYHRFLLEAYSTTSSQTAAVRAMPVFARAGAPPIRTGFRFITTSLTGRSQSSTAIPIS